MTLSPQQQLLLDRLIPVARIATDGSRAGLSVIPRTHSLVMGMSGSGKSFVARELARQLGVPCLVLNVSTWIIVAARTEPWTWSIVCQWLHSLNEARTGGVLVLDEADKGQGDTDWKSSVRLELHDLLDGIIPPSAKLPEGDTDFFSDKPVVINPGPTREELEKTLRERVMVLGCGAWQGAWRENAAQRIGFDKGPPLPTAPTREQIYRSIDPELRLRFRDTLEILTPMMPADYMAVAKNLSKSMTTEARQHWNKLIGAAILRAAEGNLGMRVFEELMLQTMLLSRESKPTPEELIVPE